jgi:hypothetical protein
MRLFKLILLFLLITSSIYTQDISFSIKGGVNYSTLEEKNIYYEDYQDTLYKLGGALYLSWERKISGLENLYLSFEIGINKKGSSIKFKSVDTADVSYQEKDYLTLEFPIIIAYEFFDNFKLYIGGYLSQVFYSDSNKVYDNTGEFGMFEADGSFMQDKGILLGLEYQHNEFLFNFRFQQGFNTIETNYSSESYGNNRQFVFMLGYKFN